MINVIDFANNQLRELQKVTNKIARKMFYFKNPIQFCFKFSITLILVVLLLAITPLYCVSNTAFAYESSQNTSHLSNVNQASVKYYESYNSKDKGISLQIVKSTSILTDKSGYHITILVKNTGSQDFPDGKIQVAFNPWYTFMSRTDLQKWSQAESRIPTPQLIGEVSVPALARGKSYNAQIDVDSNSPNLSNILYWGPKPLSVTYSSSDFKHYSSVKSFVTRANIGIKNIQTPPINVTLLIPIVAKASDWRYEINKQNISPSMNIPPSESNIASKEESKADTKKENSDKTNTKTVAGDSSQVSKDLNQFKDNRKIRLSKKSIKHIASLISLAQKHPRLQTIADLNTLKSSGISFTPSAFMQNNGFDISKYAETSNSSYYQSSGIDAESWSEESSIPKDHTGKAPKFESYAFQTGGKWTLKALEQAKSNGYKTVVATNGFDALAHRFAVKNGVYDIQTSFGNVKVLSSQETLSDLANEKPTSSKSTGENTNAGKLNRIIAQSAFYQMEQPYSSRHLLITFHQDTPSSYIDSVISNLEKSPWISLLDLRSLSNAKSFSKEYLGYNPVPKDSAISNESIINRKSILNQLSSDRENIKQFISDILDHGELNNHHVNESDVQSLAKQNAKLKINQNSNIWSKNLLKLFDAMAQREVNDSRPNNVDSKGTHNLSKILISGIHIIPPKDVTLVSETATMPITISNTNPYPVSVYLTSYTNSMEIVTPRKTPVKIAANSETQVILPLRSTTSSKARAIFGLEDRSHRDFYNHKETMITSTLQISDKSGTIIIIFAFALGILGLWRQFHRKKDPDE